MNTKEWLLKIAQEVEDDPTRWTRSSSARDKSGRFVSAISADAVCWCAVGFGWRDSIIGEIPIDELSNAAGGKFIAEYNDSLESPEQFVSWFRKAAEMCE